MDCLAVRLRLRLSSVFASSSGAVNSRTCSIGVQRMAHIERPNEISPVYAAALLRSPCSF